MIHTYLGKTISFDIHYKNRTSIGIYMDPYGKMEVQAPKGTSDEQCASIFRGKMGLDSGKNTGNEGSESRAKGERSMIMARAFFI